MQFYGVSEGTFIRMRQKLEASVLITRSDDFRYKRTTKGDALAKETLQKIP